MKVDIWSDIMCPFCYIGKRKFEAALEQFPHKEKVEISWHSFQLDPTIEDNVSEDIYDYLAKRKGQTRDWAIRVTNQISSTASEVGLSFNMDKAVVANSFEAHRLIQLAKITGKDDGAEELLFRAYFIEGRNIADKDVLRQIGLQIGLNAEEVEQLFSSNNFAQEVQYDIAVAQQLGINGVPFFVLDNKYGVSGAQSPDVFTEALQQAWTEYEKESKVILVEDTTGVTCSIDGNC